MNLTKKITNILGFLFIFLFNIFFILSILDFNILEPSINTTSNFNVSNVGGYFGASFVNIIFTLFGFWTLYLNLCDKDMELEWIKRIVFLKF